MNVLLLVIDSLRMRSLGEREPDRPRTPFLDGLGRTTLSFRRAYATECWTLPTHLSMFTGLLPSAHGAHFQSMAYARTAPTAAEIFARARFHTEVITRNSLFDGTIPGATRGFQHNTQVLAELPRTSGPFALMLALAKPRVRRLIERSGFFGVLQKQHRDFLTTLARMGIPADARSLDRVLEVMAAQQRRGVPFFLFCNLYDVHAPYAPTLQSPFASLRTPGGLLENLMLPFVLPKVSSHAYLRSGFRLSVRSRRMLLARYRRSIELMDGKLSHFWSEARSARLLDDTLVIVTADHGEAFGEHGLYFHDASVYDTHLHVPLWVHHPGLAPAVVDEVVSTRALFDVFARAAARQGMGSTLLDPAARRASPVALAEHYHYPHAEGMIGRWKQNLSTAIVGTRKLVLRREGTLHYDLRHDPDELVPEPLSLAEFAVRCRRDGVSPAAIETALDHLRRGQPVAEAA